MQSASCDDFVPHERLLLRMRIFRRSSGALLFVGRHSSGFTRGYRPQLLRSQPQGALNDDFVAEFTQREQQEGEKDCHDDQKTIEGKLHAS